MSEVWAGDRAVRAEVRARIMAEAEYHLMMGASDSGCPRCRRTALAAAPPNCRRS